MLQRCIEELERLARRLPARARVASGIAALLAMVLWGTPGVANAEEPPSAHRSMSKWPIDPDHPETGIPSEQDRNADPIEFGYWLQDVAMKGEEASKSGDHATAARMYAALGQAVPDRAVAFVKLCAEYEAMGAMDKAINACGDALLRDGARVFDYTRFVSLMLAKPDPLADKDIGALAAVLQHLREDPAGHDVVDDLECQVGARTSNVAQLEECSAAMAARAPDDTKTISYQWALAVAQHRFDDARELGARARVAGVAPESVAAMDRATAAGEIHRRWQMTFAAAAIVLLVGVLVLAGRTLARKRPLAGASAPTVSA